MFPGVFAELDPTAPAVVMADGRELTYQQLEDRSNQLAHWFRSHGLNRGDHIAFVVENRPEFFVLVWAAQRAGLYYTPCSTQLGVDEVSYIVNDCEARVLLASEHTLSVASQISTALVEHRLLLDGDAPGWSNLDTAIHDRPTSPIADQSEGSGMLYSSGSTGQPKGVLAPLPETPFPQSSGGFDLLFGVSTETVYLSPAPLYHGAPLRFTLSVQRCGGCIVIQDRFDAQEFLALVARFGVTMTLVVPTMFKRLLNLPEETRSRYDLSTLAVVVHGAAPCPIEVKERMIEWLGPIVHEVYSATEGIGLVYCDSEGWLAHKGSVGQSVTGPIHILDEAGNEVPPMKTGTVYFENSSFEYHGDSEKTRTTRDPQGFGWSTVGDIGHLDEDGFLYLTDRQSNVIIAGGVNIYPQEAENVLAVHPDVEDVAVFGIPDDDMGERVHAVVQLAEGVEPTPEMEAELIAHCRSRLARLKCPRAIDFRAELPRLDTGKLYTRLIKDEYWEGHTLTGDRTP